MENNKKVHSHGIRRIFYDILRDANSEKYSMTKFAALVGLICLVATVVMSMIIMWQKQEIDHVLLVELIGLILTLLGFKNNFGYKGNNQQAFITTDGTPVDTTNASIAPQKQLLTEQQKLSNNKSNAEVLGN